jgi:YD repeat-containing protein
MGEDCHVQQYQNTLAVLHVYNQKDDNGNITKYTYDALNCLTKITDSKNQVTQLEYDGFGNVKFIQDFGGNITSYKYDLIIR